MFIFKKMTQYGCEAEHWNLMDYREVGGRAIVVYGLFLSQKAFEDGCAPLYSESFDLDLDKITTVNVSDSSDLLVEAALKAAVPSE